MPSFDPQKAYAEQEEVFFDDGREIELLHFIYNLPEIDEIRGSPEKVLEAIDRFGRTKKYLMNVGEDKGKIVTDLIREVKPKTMVWHFTILYMANQKHGLTLSVTGRTRRLRRLLRHPLRRRPPHRQRSHRTLPHPRTQPRIRRRHPRPRRPRRPLLRRTGRNRLLRRLPRAPPLHRPTRQHRPPLPRPLQARLHDGPQTLRGAEDDWRGECVGGG